jgi:protoporphyrinogen oxidase
MMTMKDSEIQDKVTKDIQMFMPQFPDDPVFCEVFKWPKAVCLSSPGMITAVQRLKIATREYEGLHLAGEYLGMPSVEAAVHTGVNAARMILRSS